MLKSPVRLVASCASRAEFAIGKKSFQGAQLARTLPRVCSQVPEITITLTITITTTISTGTNIAKGLLPGASNKVSNEMVGRSSSYGFEHFVSEYDVNCDH